jgi:RimJ/RimL family protein N-acetyltransferase
VKVPDSERLTFRLLNKNDLNLLFELDQDPEVMRFINGGQPHSMDDIHQVYQKRIAKFTLATKGWGIWGVFLKETSDFVGWILVRPMHFFSEQPEWDNIELGWRFKRKFWGKGIATEAAQQVAKVIVEEQSISKLCAIADQNNLASIQIMKKLGMSFVKQYLHRDPIGDFDVVYYEKRW